jgi:Uma2 family endonuclease
MNAPLVRPPRLLTLADLLESLGDIDPRRVRYEPRPGTATVQDVIDLDAHEDRLFELIDGVLVEKSMRYREGLLAVRIAILLDAFVRPHKLGLITGADGTVQLLAGLVRIPDVSFVSWARLPDKRVPVEPVPELAPDLAVEVLSISNTPKEMARKRREYFQAGVRLVWEVDPERRQVSVYSEPEHATVRTEADTLDGGDVLPGFTLPLKDLFAALDEQGN